MLISASQSLGRSPITHLLGRGSFLAALGTYGLLEAYTNQKSCKYICRPINKLLLGLVWAHAVYEKPGLSETDNAARRDQSYASVTL